MRKTTVVIDEDLLGKAIQAVGARNKKEAIEAGLRSLVQKHNRELLSGTHGPEIRKLHYLFILKSMSFKE